MIGELREEWERINDAITALERLARETRHRRGRPLKSRSIFTSERRSNAEDAIYGAGLRKAGKPSESSLPPVTQKDQN